MTGDPSWIRGELQPAGLVPQRVPGLHDRGGEGRGPPARALEAIVAYRDGGCGCPPPPSPELIREMMASSCARPCPTSTSRCCSRRWSSTASTPREVDLPRRAPRPRAAFPVVVIGCGESGLLAGIRLQAGRHPVHDRREERRRRRHLVREPLPGLPGRRRQPLLLLLVRALRPLDRVLLPAARAASGYFDGRGPAPRRSTRTSASAPRSSRPPGTTTPGRWTCACAPPTAPRRPSTPGPSSPRSVSSTGRSIPDIPGLDNFAGPVVPLRPLGPLGRPHGQAGRR